MYFFPTERKKSSIAVKTMPGSWALFVLIQYKIISPLNHLQNSGYVWQCFLSPLSCPWIPLSSDCLKGGCSAPWRRSQCNFLPRACRKYETAIPFLVMLSLLFGILSHNVEWQIFHPFLKFLRLFLACVLLRWRISAACAPPPWRKTGEGFVSKVKKMSLYVRKVHPWPSVAVTSLKKAWCQLTGGASEDVIQKVLTALTDIHILRTSDLHPALGQTNPQRKYLAQYLRLSK